MLLNDILPSVWRELFEAGDGDIHDDDALILSTPAQSPVGLQVTKCIGLADQIIALGMEESEASALRAIVVEQVCVWVYG